MSTKTTIKRIALVAAVAAAFGGLSTVAANATANTTTVATLTAETTTPVGGTVGNAATDSILLATTTTPTSGEAITLTPSIVSEPVGSTVAVGAIASGKVGLATTTAIGNWTTATTAGVVTQTAGSSAVAISTPTAAATLSLDADVPGTYVVTVTPSGAITTNTAVTVTFYITGGRTPVVAIAGGAPSTSATNTVTVGSYSSITLNAGTNDSLYTIASTGVGSIAVPTQTTIASASTGTAGISATGATWFHSATAFDVPGSGTNTIFGASSALNFSAYSATAGTQTITMIGNSSAAITVTITWGAAAVPSAANSVIVASDTADIQAGASGVQETTSDTLTPVVKTVVATADNTTAGVGIYVNLKNNATPSVTYTADQISASVSGPGLLKIGSASTPTLSGSTGLLAAASGASAGRSVLAAANGYALVYVYADGTAGTSTVTISDATAGITLGTVSVTFYSPTIASLKATTQYNVPLAAVTNFTAKATEGFTGAAGTATVGAPVYVTAADVNGDAIPNSASSISVTSSATNVANVATNPNWDATNSYYYPLITPVSEGKTTLTFTDVSTGLVVAKTDVLVTKAVVAAITASTDASSYDPGTKVVYTITATDAAGNPVADGAYSDFFNAAYPTSNVGLQGSLPAANSVSFVGGVNISTLYAPLSTAAVTIAGGTIGSGADVATALQASTLPTASFATTGSAETQASAATDAANEATDAANAATDAANAAADAADAATSAAQDAGAKADAALAAVTALSAKITVLAAQIAKIVKKLKA